MCRKAGGNEGETHEYERGEDRRGVTAFRRLPYRSADAPVCIDDCQWVDGVSPSALQDLQESHDEL